MPDFFPFPGLRYRLDALGAGLEDLTAPPYDVIDAEARARLEASHPKNAVHLILPRDHEPGDRYGRAAAAFAEWQESGVLAADPPRYYLYRMVFIDDAGASRQMTGVIGALELSPPGEGRILPHERTMPKPRGDRLDLLRAVGANLDPVWCLSLASGLSDLLKPTGPPVAASVDEDGVEHSLFLLPEELAGPLAERIRSTPLVIADGHHRFETALNYQRETGPETGADRIMALVVELSAEQLSVRPIHRILTGAGPDLRARLARTFTITPKGANTAEGVRELSAAMLARGAMGLVDPDGLALLELRLDVVAGDLEQLPEPLRDVDSARLEAAFARIGPPESLDFHPDPLVVAAAVAKGTAEAGVLLRPVSVRQIQAVAEAGERMPEKTTYFWPKPLTGLVFRKLTE